MKEWWNGTDLLRAHAERRTQDWQFDQLLYRSKQFQNFQQRNSSGCSPITIFLALEKTFNRQIVDDERLRKSMIIDKKSIQKSFQLIDVFIDDSSMILRC